jgi:hypothetical protein
MSQSIIEKGGKVMSGEERLRIDSGFSYLIREVQQLFEQLSVASFIREVLIIGCEAKNSDV